MKLWNPAYRRSYPKYAGSLPGQMKRDDLLQSSVRYWSQRSFNETYPMTFCAHLAISKLLRELVFALLAMHLERLRPRHLAVAVFRPGPLLLVQTERAKQ